MVGFLGDYWHAQINGIARSWDLDWRPGFPFPGQ